VHRCLLALKNCAFNKRTVVWLQSQIVFVLLCVSWLQTFPTITKTFPFALFVKNGAIEFGLLYVHFRTKIMRNFVIDVRNIRGTFAQLCG